MKNILFLIYCLFAIACQGQRGLRLGDLEKSKTDSSYIVVTNYGGATDGVAHFRGPGATKKILGIRAPLFIDLLASNDTTTHTAAASAQCPAMTLAKFDSCGITNQYFFDCTTSNWIQYEIGKSIGIDSIEITYIPTESGNTTNLGRFVRSDSTVMVRERNAQRFIDHCGRSINFSESKGYIFYVSRPVDGLANASNPLFVEQLRRARIGDDHAPYPSISSARDAAAALLESGAITKATIWVFSSNYFKFGSAEDSENLGETADEGLYTDTDWYNSVAAIKKASLIRNNLDYYFEPNSGIINIANRSYTPFFCWAEPGGTSDFGNVFPAEERLECNILGHGSFINRNGQSTATDATARFIFFRHPKMYCNFEFESIKFKSFRLVDPGIRNFSFTGNVIETEYCNVIDINNAADSCSINVKIGTLRIGPKYTDYAVAEPDYWYPIAIGYLTNSLVNIEIDNAYIEETDHFLLRAYQLDNTSLNIHLGNLTHQVGAFNTFSSYARPSLSMELLSNNRISYTIDNADAERPFGANLDVRGSNNRVLLRANNYTTKPKRYGDKPPAVMVFHGTSEEGYDPSQRNNLVVITGVFTSERSDGLFLGQGVPSGQVGNHNVKILFDNCVFKSLDASACKMNGNDLNDDKYYFRNCAFISSGELLDIISADGSAHSITFLGGNTATIGVDPLINIIGVPINIDPAFKF